MSSLKVKEPREFVYDVPSGYERVLVDEVNAYVPVSLPDAVEHLNRLLGLNVPKTSDVKKVVLSKDFQKLLRLLYPWQKKEDFYHYRMGKDEHAFSVPVLPGTYTSIRLIEADKLGQCLEKKSAGWWKAILKFNESDPDLLSDAERGDVVAWPFIVGEVRTVHNEYGSPVSSYLDYVMVKTPRMLSLFILDLSEYIRHVASKEL